MVNFGNKSLYTAQIIFINFIS